MNKREPKQWTDVALGLINMWANLAEENIIKANAQFWEQMLAMRLESVPGTSSCCLGSGHMLGFVVLGGAWIGRIEVRMDSGLAYEATAAMMMQPVETLAEADVIDAIKEIANMIAGTIKSSLPRPCTMNVPESSIAGGDFRSICNASDCMAVAFRHTTGAMIVRILERKCSCSQE
jgi:CheY-specific phosphatase CheX